MAVTGIGTYASYTNSYGNTQNAGNKTGRMIAYLKKTAETEIKEDEK